MVNHAGQDLHGKSFARMDLHGADFTGANLRGADFGGADLSDANFEDARIGLGRGAVALYGLSAAALGALTGFLASWLGEHVRRAFDSPFPGTRLVAFVITAEIVLYVLAALWRGTPFAMRQVALPGLALLATTGVIAIVFGAPGARVATLFATAAATTALFVLVIAVAAFARGLATAGSRVLMAAVLAATVLGVRRADGTGLAVTVALVSTVASGWVRRGDRRMPGAARALEELKTVGGTSFRDANLAGANFTGARVRNTDFRGARLERARFDGAREIAFCRFDPGAAPAARTEKP